MTRCPCCGRIVGWWPESDAEALRQFWARGLTGGQIERKFGGRYSRAAILAKVKRMKVARDCFEREAA
jgi:hypothetical protein